MSWWSLHGSATRQEYDITIPTHTLHVCDLDGTLLRSDGSLSPYTRDTVNALIDQGHLVTVASARSAVGMRSLLAGLKLRLPVIELNGAAITDLDSGRRAEAHTLSRETALSAISAMLAADGAPIVIGWDAESDLVHYGARTNAGSQWFVDEKQAYGDPRLRASRDLLAVPEGSTVATVVGFVPDARSREVTAELEAAVGAVATVRCASNLYVPGWSEIEVAHPFAEKGRAAGRLRTFTGLEEASLVVYGDHLNDLSMFAVADRRVAPSNAHPDVLRRADLVIGHHDDDAVAHHLASLLA